MPLAWFSEEEGSIFHVCFNCFFDNPIQPENLVIMSAQDDIERLTGLKKCDSCANHDSHPDDWKCQVYDSEHILDIEPSLEC